VISSSQTPSEQKSVSFALHAQARHSLHVNDYTEDEYVACWFGPDEMDNVMYAIFCTIDIMENMLEVDEENYYSRGLERMTSIGRGLKMHNRLKARVTILDGQQEGVRDHDKVPKAYQECTQLSTNVAYYRGVSDTNFVFAFLKRAKNIDNRSEYPILLAHCNCHRLPRKVSSSTA
jgi:hypothetical protein